MSASCCSIVRARFGTAAAAGIFQTLAKRKTPADEDITAAAFRELKEETGVVSASLLCVTPGWLAYNFPADYKKKNWKGQRQKWAAMLFEGEDSEVDLQADDFQEFDDWRWGELEEAPSLIVPFKRHVYEDIVTGFAPLRNFIRTQR